MKLIEVVASQRSLPTVQAIADKYKAYDFRTGPIGEDDMRAMRILTRDDKVQAVLDALQSILGAQPSARVLVIPVDLTIPQPDEDSATMAREALYTMVERNARLDGNYLLLVLLSTIVAAIGLVEDSAAVVIGAMVIAPLLGPNLALGLGTALGDLELMRKAVLTTLAGVALAVALSLLLGLLWPFTADAHELLSRTDVGMESLALALASGAAAALSLTTGLPSVLVGVMVAVALLPPAAALGLMLGHGEIRLATGAGLLLAVNIVSINLACKLVFLLKGIRPRDWWGKEKAKRAMWIYLLVWLFTLLVLGVIIVQRDALPT